MPDFPSTQPVRFPCILGPRWGSGSHGSGQEAGLRDQDRHWWLCVCVCLSQTFIGMFLPGNQTVEEQKEKVSIPPKSRKKTKQAHPQALAELPTGRWMWQRSCTLSPTVDFPGMLLAYLICALPYSIFVNIKTQISPGRVAQLLGVSSHAPTGPGFDPAPPWAFGRQPINISLSHRRLSLSLSQINSTFPNMSCFNLM